MSKTTALYPEHESLGASFTDFGGWTMPLKYKNELEEHRAVRGDAGLFDLSHMGELRVRGPEAARFLDRALISALSSLAVGRAKYSMALNDEGGIIDDLITYRLGEEDFLVIPNASNKDTVLESFRRTAEGLDVSIEDATDTTTLIAVQGPRSAALLTSLLTEESATAASELRYYAWTTVTFTDPELTDIPIIAARTGYTGEDGFELYISDNPEASRRVWTLCREAGATPCGLAARDSLRLEAGMPLYGHELSTELSPADAGLAVLIGKKKEEAFVGKEALEKKPAPSRVLAGLRGEGRRAAREGAVLYTADGQEVGQVTSGQLSPTLGYPVALAYLEKEYSDVGTELEADIRGKRYPYAVCATPFYRREK
ncbi:glycine cleavage system aminomethyltransferase GcvT [Corynebacterium uropygiale]|uniref:Aminomethyltransferase n=1 Tax=Corynebacterium uropygiale TaxID=1775911 RepID=A0A9X1TXL6_9CORY|nr:glycine cleavage system aminomethyltransferase GcvT [Corynebacterium uropygiale]MCF4006245.1 glycine cleavage system aminomethyltransferase GcvT [Corynebacterium uropygiale]